MSGAQGGPLCRRLGLAGSGFLPGLPVLSLVATGGRGPPELRTKAKPAGPGPVAPSTRNYFLPRVGWGRELAGAGIRMPGRRQLLE